MDMELFIVTESCTFKEELIICKKKNRFNI
jgi:hypothetical protein